MTLTKNLNLEAHSWLPIVGFNGTFDGQGNTISGVIIESTDGSQGLFGTIGTSATIKNLVIANSSITGGNNTGAVVGNAEGNIENCHVLGDVTIAGTSFSNHGGIAGYCGGNINDCTSAAIMTATDEDGVSQSGGIVGTSTGSVSKCLYYGTRLHKDMNHQPRLLAGSNGGEMNYIPRYDDDLNHLA